MHEPHSCASLDACNLGESFHTFRKGILVSGSEDAPISLEPASSRAPNAFDLRFMERSVRLEFKPGHQDDANRLAAGRIAESGDASLSDVDSSSIRILKQYRHFDTKVPNNIREAS